MKTLSQQLKKYWKKEKPQSFHINVLGHYDETTLIDKNNQLIKLFSVGGIDASTLDDERVDAFKNRCNRLWKKLSSQYAIYSWVVRSDNVRYPEGDFNAGFAKTLNDAYQKKIQQKTLYSNRLYIAVIAKSPEGYLNKLSKGFSQLNHKFNKSARDNYLQETLKALNAVSEEVERTLAPYGINALGLAQKEMHSVSESLSFLSELINGSQQDIRYLPVNAATLIPQNRLFFHSQSGGIEAHCPNGKRRYAAAFSIKGYPSFTQAGLLDEVFALPYDMVVTQSYRFFDPQTAKSRLKNQQSELLQTHDDAISQTLELSDVLDETAGGDIGYGEHHMSIILWNNTKEGLVKAASDLSSTLSKQDIIVVKEDRLAECAFWAQLPGNFSYSPRPAAISSKNLAGFVSLHNPALGTSKGNHWGDAVTLLEMAIGSPYYFNFHYRDVGNTLIFGAMGAGKTALMGFLLAQSLKFGGKRIVFDKDRGLEILVRALGGHYERLTPGLPTGFNPCQLPDTPENRAFLAYLLKSLLTVHDKQWDASDSEVVQKVIEGLYTLPKNERRFSDIAPYFGIKTKGSLRARFDEWHTGGNKAWVFDNTEDSLNLSSDMIGFEMGAILKESDTKTPICLYLMHRINKALEGERGAIFADEGWAMLDDPFFKKEIEEWGRTPRKKNRFLCLATQSADDAVKTAVSDVLSQSAACKIFFTNPSAKESTYRDALGLSQREYELVKTMDEEKRFFLLQYAKGKESVVARLDLNGLEKEISVISGRETTVLLLDALRKRCGDAPDVWLPLFYDMLPHIDTYRKTFGNEVNQWIQAHLDKRSQA